MIFLLAGTSEARALTRLLHEAGFPVLVSTVTEHGAKTYRSQGIPVRTGRLDAQGMLALFKEQGVRLVVDATHPFAVAAHQEAAIAAQAARIPCVRLDRKPLPLPVSPYLHPVQDDKEAAEVAAAIGGTVLLTTGSKHLAVYTQRLLPEEQVRLVVRLLPTVENMQLCAELGLDQRDIVAIQGPFGDRLNQALYEHFAVRVLITKESGAQRWIAEKVHRAMAQGIHVVLIRRPPGVPGVPAFFDPVSLIRFVQAELKTVIMEGQ